MEIYNTYSYDVTVFTNIEEANGIYREFIVSAKQSRKIDIKTATLDLVKFEAQNPSGQPVLINNAYFQEVSPTVARETTRTLLIGDKGKIDVPTASLRFSIVRAGERIGGPL